MSEIDRLEAPVAVAPMTEAKPWLRAWWRLVDMRIGIIPLPLFPLILALMAGFVWLGKLPPDLTMMIPLIALGAYVCAEIGRNIPILRNVGGAAIIATFLPSYLVYAHLLPAPVIKSVTDFTKQSNFLYLFICCIIVGSILGMQRDVLIKGFLKVFVPLITGSIAAAIVGTMVGWSLGLGAIHTLFYIVVPIMGGGVGEGALPLSLGYATVTHQPQGVIFATIIPAVMLGGLTAIIFAGALNYLGKRYPHLTGEGRLQPSEHGDALANAEIAEEERPTNQPITAATVAAAGLTAITLYLVGMMVQDLTGFPAPVTNAVHRSRAQVASCDLHNPARRRRCRLPVLRAGRDLPVAIRDRHCPDALGRFGCDAAARDPDHHRLDRRNHHGHRLRCRPLG